MTAEVSFPINKEDVTRFSTDRQDPKWFADLRLSALEQALSLDLPKPDKTNITKWNFNGFSTETGVEAANKYTALSEAERTLTGVEADVSNIVVQKNGQNRFTALTDDLKDKGVIFTDIQTALSEHSDLVKKYFMQDAVNVNEHRLTALHAAALNGGIFIYIPKNVEVKEPLQSVFTHAGDFGLFNHVLIVAEANSQLTYVENYLSEGSKENAFVNIIAEIYVEDGAEVRFGAVDNLSEDVVTYVNRRGQVNGRDAKLYWALGQMNDGNTVSENTTYLVGEGSYGDTKTVAIGRGSQVQNFTTNVVHFGKNSDGQILKHGVMKDAATSIFNGVSKIEHGATKANGEQTERVLMLSEKARGDANPILLIDEDDVTAGHAASVGKIDPVQMFYLMSRGMSKIEAERLIIHGFLNPVVSALPIDSVKEQLFDVIERKVY
ncbi:Fe-S cluster assembly protein SufD [Salisediminibacterium selenitireducens]|uniref:FeS assembly protein SufD n=1 Tax=Bacillus selenitireducens (strain ATCC 700615 / DSM 15326 / MLS10) TaxID=439292 RepID=D6Y166_BACIE|nr:Fe-S cluster assembly protein SufD [Salisediminibacterium selenitireducens]ADH98670.1 FeS assembly protein SufD [[Bacillus] selenitireducens MLS10]